MNKQNIKFVRGNPERSREIEQMLNEIDVRVPYANIYRNPNMIYYFGEDKKLRIENVSSLSAQLIIENCEELFLPAVFKYKVGDKVICSTADLIGEIKELTDINGDPYYLVQTSCGTYTYGESSLKPYVPLFKFKVGDCVKIHSDDAADDEVGIVESIVASFGGNVYTIETPYVTINKQEDCLELYDLTKIKTWDGLVGTPRKGYYIDESALIQDVVGVFNHNDQNVAATEEVAKSMLAMAQISQILPYYDTPITKEEWNDFSVKKWVVFRNRNSIKIDHTYQTFMYLSFHTKEKAEEFLANNQRLVKDYLMIKD